MMAKDNKSPKQKEPIHRAVPRLVPRGAHVTSPESRKRGRWIAKLLPDAPRSVRKFVATRTLTTPGYAIYKLADEK